MVIQEYQQGLWNVAAVVFTLHMRNDFDFYAFEYTIFILHLSQVSQSQPEFPRLKNKGDSQETLIQVLFCVAINLKLKGLSAVSAVN